MIVPAVTSKSASAWVAPTLANVAVPVPAVTTSVRFWVAALSALIVEVKLTLLSAVPSVLIVTFAPSTTLPPANVAVLPP